ncbi:transposase [Actinospica sp. MGRD01-02]|uniref:Transposase n=1 Tax=Actinospica acidithermotolerans TaxID=2828514 RepID=A0A941ECX6_9ACTN|nr:transposase [Actinospica acidithermotolerans]
MVFDHAAFASQLASRGRPPASPGTLATVSVLQFAEGLTDRQAADAVRLSSAVRLADQLQPLEVPDLRDNGESVRARPPPVTRSAWARTSRTRSKIRASAVLFSARSTPPPCAYLT